MGSQKKCQLFSWEQVAERCNLVLRHDTRPENPALTGFAAWPRRLKHGDTIEQKLGETSFQSGTQKSQIGTQKLPIAARTGEAIGACVREEVTHAFKRGHQLAPGTYENTKRPSQARVHRRSRTPPAVS